MNITEGRDAAVYHGTTLPGLLAILATDTLGREGDPEHGGGFVCVSRDKGYARRFVGSPEAAVLVLDQAKLTQRYKIVPYDKDWNAIDAILKAEEGDDWLGPVERFDEMEERIYGTIHPLSRYLLGIEVGGDYLRDFGPHAIGWETAVKHLGNDEDVRSAIAALLSNPLVVLRP